MGDETYSKMLNVALCVMRSTQVVRHQNGRGRSRTHVDSPDAIADAARQLAEMVLFDRGIVPTTGIFVDGPAKTPQPDECYCCGRAVKAGCPEFLIDRDTSEVLPLNDSTSDRGAFWPVGPECRKQYPDIMQYAREQ